MKNYQYLCDDKSVCYPFLKKHLWAPCLRFIPLRRSANTITLLGNLCSFVAFAFLALTPLTGVPSAAFLLPSAALFLYLSLDNIDGAQARRSGSSSPLGEFLDHWCDAFNAGFMVLGFCLATGFPAWQTLLILGVAGLAYLATMWEQRTTGWLKFGPVGTVEGILLTCMMYVLVAIFGVEAVARTPVLGSLSGAQLFYIIACTGFAHQALSSILRVRKHLGDFLPLAAMLTLGSFWYALGDVDFTAMAFFFVCTSCLTGGRQIIARVRERPYRPGDLVVFVGATAGLVAGLAGASSLSQSVLAWSLVAYLAFQLGGDFVRTTTALSEYLRPRELLSTYFLRHR